MASYITPLIVIEQTVIVNVEFAPLADICLHGAECSRNPAVVKPVMVAARKDGGPVFMYPKSVLKQNLGLAGVDMTILFNENLDWHFEVETNIGSYLDPINIGTKYDFELWASKSLVKGLGFMSGLVTRLSSFKTNGANTTFKYFTPGIKTALNNTSLENITSFQPLYALDSILRNFNIPISDIMDFVHQMPSMSDTSQEDYLKAFESNTGLIKKCILATSTLRNIKSTVPLLKFANDPSKNRHRLEVQGENVGEHVEFYTVPYRHEVERNYLLSADANSPGKSLRNEMMVRRVQALFGEHVLFIFEQIGYSSVKSQQSPKFEPLELIIDDLEATEYEDRDSKRRKLSFDEKRAVSEILDLKHYQKH